MPGRAAAGRSLSDGRQSLRDLLDGTVLSGYLLLLNILGGVALLLWATRMVRTGILRAYGGELRRSLGRSSRSQATAAAMGLGAAALLQSSTATAVLTVSFASRGLVTVGAGLAVMLGADLGSTLVVQILSFDISAVSPFLLLLGVALFMSSSLPFRRHIGRVFIGLGLLLLSLQLIVGASEPLRSSALLPIVVAHLADELLLAALLAALLTWLSHSSVAMVLLIMTFTLVGIVPLELSFALVLGANVGSGLIPLLLTLAEPAEARRIPLGNLIFRCLGALLLLPFLAQVAPLIAAVDDHPARQVANFHSAFNLALLLLFLPCTGLMARLTERLLPARETPQSRAAPRYLDPAAIRSPAIAISCATREVLRMADVVETMLRDVIEVFRNDDEKRLSELSKLDDEVDTLHRAIKLYLAETTRETLSEDDERRCSELITFTTNLEHIGDIIDKSLLEIARKKRKHKLTFSAQGWSELQEMHAEVADLMTICLGVFVSGDLPTARRLIAAKERLRDLELEGRVSHLDRLRSGRIESIETSALHVDVLRDLKRIASHLTSIAYPLLDAEGELRSSRLRSDPEPEAAETGSDIEDPEGHRQIRAGEAS